jgi:hypothetical protein
MFIAEPIISSHPVLLILQNKFDQVRKDAGIGGHFDPPQPDKPGPLAPFCILAASRAGAGICTVLYKFVQQYPYRWEKVEPH